MTPLRLDQSAPLEHQDIAPLRDETLLAVRILLLTVWLLSTE